MSAGIVGVDEAAELLPYMIREATSDVGERAQGGRVFGLSGFEKYVFSAQWSV